MLKKTSYYTSKKEIKDLTKAWIILSLAFAIFFMGGLSFTFDFILAWGVSALTVGTAFIFHELGHKIVAQHYGYSAEFRSFDNMLWLALFMSFLGFIFAAPGAVMISGPYSIARNGKISAFGPGINMALALVFLIINYLFNTPVINVIAYYGFLVNSWLALFNMLPFGMFDGKKVLNWNKTVYGVMVGVALLLMFMQGMPV